MNEVGMDWLRLALSRSVVRRAAGVAVTVGGLLVVVNHGSALLSGDISTTRALQIIVTALVPYCVSTYSSVCALRERIAAGDDARLRAPETRVTLDESRSSAVTQQDGVM
jgi:hypothetical protein